MSRLVAGVVGNPIEHSLSPLIHNAWIAAAGIDASYDRYLGPREGFADFVRGLRGQGLRGLNVTLPFKEEALALADEASPIATTVGAANLLLFRPDGSIFADNTDGEGLLYALRKQAPQLRIDRERLLVLGAGGAARGAVAALVGAGAPSVEIYNRTPEKAEALAGEMGGPVKAVRDLDRAFAANTVVINATSTLLSGGAEHYPLQRLPADAVVMHMTYKPIHPPLLEQAAALGRTIVDGLDMLIGQAIPSFEAFFGQPPDPAVDVRALALAALGEKP